MSLALSPTDGDRVRTGLIRISQEEIPGKKELTELAIKDNGTLELALPARITAKVLAAQLAQFGINNVNDNGIKGVSEEVLEGIAGLENSGGEIDSPYELAALDAYLEWLVQQPGNERFLSMLVEARNPAAFTAFINADISVRSNPDSVYYFVDTVGNGILNYADDSLKDNPDFIIRLVGLAPRYFAFASESLKGNPDFLLEASSIDPRILEWMDPALKKDREFIVAFSDIIPEAIGYADPSLQLGSGYWLAYDLLQKHPDYYNYYESFWSPAVQDELNNYLKQQAAFLNITAERFTTDTLWQVVHMRQRINDPEPRPLAVVLYPLPEADYNGSFSYAPEIGELIGAGYRVEYFEAGTDEEAFEDLKMAAASRQAQYFQISGHGARFLTRIGGPPWLLPIPYLTDQYFIDLSDEERMKALNLSRFLAPNAVVALKSCSAGNGSNQSDVKPGSRFDYFSPNNMARLMKRAFPQARVFAPTQVADRLYLKKDEKGMISSVVFSGYGESWLRTIQNLGGLNFAPWEKTETLEL